MMILECLTTCTMLYFLAMRKENLTQLHVTLGEQERGLMFLTAL